CARNYDWFAYW
nr:immunoglobulin heavy chain junction region [Mus musculus]MBK4185819.1 immunoglobulin heavy chain junction region [Mus musculus]